jgi:hypothetical protein
MAGRVYVVDASNPRASDKNSGAAGSPLKTINRAAELAQPGDTVSVRAGVYRERVNPRRGGLPGKPITYTAAPGDEHKVFIRGSEPFSPAWKLLADGVYSGSLSGLKMGSKAYAGHLDPAINGEFNPYLRNFNRGSVARPHSEVVAAVKQQLNGLRQQVEKEVAEGVDIAFSSAQKRKGDVEAELGRLTRRADRVYRTTLGQVFVDGTPLNEVQTQEELYDLAGTWMASPEGDALLVHFPQGRRPKGCLVEVSVRHTCFSPLERGLGYITVRGLVLEHGANHFPTWGGHGWAQQGLLSTRSGHHWVIENNIVRYAKSVGIDCGSEGGGENMENRGTVGQGDGHTADRFKHAGWHVISSNHICDNGHCGLTGIGHYGTRIVGNVIERNNRDGWTSPWWEMAGIKFHFFFDGVIEGNLIRDNEAHGIWLDNKFCGSRVTRNIIINNRWSGVNIELGRGPVLIDNNIIAYTRQGDGVYGHDASDVMIAHNLIYANSAHGVWFAYCTKRVKNEDGCWDIKAFNNLIMGNGKAAIGLPIPWECAGNNVTDSNVLMGSGAYLDEGSGPMDPQFVITNKTHCGQFPPHCGAKVPMTPANTLALFTETLTRAGVPKEQWPNLNDWERTYAVSLDLWRRLLGNDANSIVVRAIRDGLASRTLWWECNLDPAIASVKCSPVAGVDKDFMGNRMTGKAAAKLMPGPFQKLRLAPSVKQHIQLWPVRGVTTTWQLP